MEEIMIFLSFLIDPYIKEGINTKYILREDVENILNNSNSKYKSENNKYYKLIKYYLNLNNILICDTDLIIDEFGDFDYNELSLDKLLEDNDTNVLRDSISYYDNYDIDDTNEYLYNKLVPFIERTYGEKKKEIFERLFLCGDSVEKVANMMGLSINSIRDIQRELLSKAIWYTKLINGSISDLEYITYKK